MSKKTITLATEEIEEIILALLRQQNYYKSLYDDPRYSKWKTSGDLKLALVEKLINNLEKIRD